MQTNHEHLEPVESFVARSGRTIGLLADRVIHAVALYLELRVTPDGHLESQALEAVKNEIANSALAFRLARAEKEIVNVLDGDLDPKPALALLRDVQDSLILLASGRPGYPQAAVPRGQVELTFREPLVADFLMNVVGEGTESS